MTAETSNARGEWVLVPRNPTEAMIDAWRDAPDIWEDAYAAMLAAAPQPPSAPVGVEWPMSLLRADNWREVHIGHRCMRLEVTYEHSTWERLMEQVEAALAQQPAALDEAMVERAWVAFCENNGSARQGIRAALTAALAAQPGGAE